VVSEMPAPRPSLANEAAHWHALQRQGGVTPEQQRQFMKWLVTSPAHLREYITVSRVASELSDALRGMAVDLDALIAAGPPAADDNVVALPVRRRPPPPVASRAPAGYRRRGRVAAGGGSCRPHGLATDTALRGGARCAAQLRAA